MFKKIRDLTMIRTGKPIRRNLLIRPTVDEDGNPGMELVEAELFMLSPDGSVDRLNIKPDRFLHCGCPADRPMGGQCEESGCKRVSCAQCFGRCQRCSKPICLEHSLYIDDRAGRPLRFCRDCHEHILRRGRLAAATRFLLSPVIEFDNGDTK